MMMMMMMINLLAAGVGAMMVTSHEAWDWASCWFWTLEQGRQRSTLELGNVDPNETKLTWFTHDSSPQVVQAEGKPMILFGETAARILAKPWAQAHSEVQLFQLYTSSLYMSDKRLPCALICHMLVSESGKFSYSLPSGGHLVAHLAWNFVPKTHWPIIQVVVLGEAMDDPSSSECPKASKSMRTSTRLDFWDPPPFLSSKLVFCWLICSSLLILLGI